MSAASHSSRHYLIAITAFALPTAGLLVLRLLAPATTPASAGVEVNLIGAPAEPSELGFAMLDSDRALLKVFQEAETQAPARLGLGLGQRVAQDQTRGPTTHATDLSAGVALTSVMKTSGGTVAAIQGKLYRVGDRLNPEWTVGSIDDATLSVTLVHLNGQTMVLSIESKKQ